MDSSLGRGTFSCGQSSSLMGLDSSRREGGRAEGGLAATVGVPRRRSCGRGCLSVNLPLRVSPFGWEGGMSTAVCLSPSLRLTVSLSACRISLFSILASLPASIQLSHLLLSFSVFRLFFSVCACVSLCINLVDTERDLNLVAPGRAGHGRAALRPLPQAESRAPRWS